MDTEPLKQKESTLGKNVISLKKLKWYLINIGVEAQNKPQVSYFI